jgi:polysaccharide deacetylase 2 family uncharacterized protein YibQ
MEREEIAGRLARMAQEVPQAVGAMNHMGSAFTTDPDAMDAFAETLKGMGYFFVDGATAPDSLGMEASGKAGVTAVQRDVFFDDDPAPEALSRQWGRRWRWRRRTGGPCWSAIPAGRRFPRWPACSPLCGRKGSGR